MSVVKGDTGERGDSGDRGVEGERGPKGDHGQHGDTGARGAQGDTGKVPTFLAAVLVVVLLALTALTFVQVQRIGVFSQDLRGAALTACERHNATRAVTRDILRDDVRARRELPPSFFPGIPPADFERLIQRGERDAADQLARLAEVNCQAQVP